MVWRGALRPGILISAWYFTGRLLFHFGKVNMLNMMLGILQYSTAFSSTLLKSIVWSQLIQLNVFCTTHLGLATFKLTEYLAEAAGSIPESDEGEAEEETQGSSELRHQGGKGVNQLLFLHSCIVGHGVDGKDWQGGVEISFSSWSDTTVASIPARLPGFLDHYEFQAPAPRPLCYILWLKVSIISVEFIISPVVIWFNFV